LLAFSAMRLKFLWPGKTKSPNCGMQGFYESRIRSFAACDVIETREAAGSRTSTPGRSRTRSAGLEKHLDGLRDLLEDRGRR